MASGPERYQRAGDVLATLAIYQDLTRRVPPSLSALYHDSLPYGPDLRYALVDLRALPADGVAGSPPVRVAVRLLRAIFERTLARQLPDILRALRGYPRNTPGDIVEEALTYVLTASERMTHAAFAKAVQALGDPGEGAEMPTLMEQWLAEKWNEGLQEGRASGLHEAAELVLARFGTDGLALLPAVRAVDDVKVLRAILRADSLDDIRRALGT